LKKGEKTKFSGGVNVNSREREKTRGGKQMKMKKEVAGENLKARWERLVCF